MGTARDLQEFVRIVKKGLAKKIISWYNYEANFKQDNYPFKYKENIS